MRNIFETMVGVNNSKLIATLPQVLSGDVVIIHTEPTKNENFLSVYMVQKKDISRASGQAKGSDVSSLAKSLKGWEETEKAPYLIRHIETFSVAALAAHKLDVGSVIPDAELGVADSYEPNYKKEPIIDRDGVIKTSQGKPFYQHTCFTDKTSWSGDIIFKVDYVAKAVTAPVIAKEFSVKG